MSVGVKASFSNLWEELSRSGLCLQSKAHADCPPILLVAVSGWTSRESYFSYFVGPRCQWKVKTGPSSLCPSCRRFQHHREASSWPRGKDTTLLSGWKIMTSFPSSACFKWWIWSESLSTDKSLCLIYLSQLCIMEMFKYTKKVKEEHNEHVYTYPYIHQLSKLCCTIGK